MLPAVERDNNSKLKYKNLKSIKLFNFIIMRKIRFLFIYLLIILANGCIMDDNQDPASQLPGLTTVTISDITTNSANSGGNITSDGGTTITARGVCWSTSEGPTIAANKTSDGAGTGSYTSNITGLLPKTKYYTRAYATNNEGTAYGQEVNFTTEDVSLSGGLIAYWKLDENTGSIVSDEMNNWDLSFVNTPLWSSSGKINSSVDFGTTTTSHLERTGINSGNKNTYTLAAWIYLVDGTADAKYIMGMNSGGNAINAGAAEVKITIVNDNKLAALYHTSDGWTGPMQRISSVTIELGTWYHVAAIINNGNIELYINGVIDNANPVTNTLNSNLNFANGRVTVGNARLYNGSYITTRWFRGKIDEAAIWNRPLTSGEINTLYNNGNGIQHPF